MKNTIAEFWFDKRTRRRVTAERQYLTFKSLISVVSDDRRLVLLFHGNNTIIV